jgi:hypothetical protein
MTDLINSDWQEQDANNTNPSPNGVQGGYSPSQVAPILRAIRGAVKRAYVQGNAIYTTTGTSTGLVLTFAQAPASYSKRSHLSILQPYREHWSGNPQHQ